jgi:hypothetical protein
MVMGMFAHDSPEFAAGRALYVNMDFLNKCSEQETDG